jgi:hypothetical protein
MELHKNVSSYVNEETHRLIDRNDLPILPSFSHTVTRTNKIQINCIFITPRLELLEGVTEKISCSNLWFYILIFVFTRRGMQGAEWDGKM